MSNQSKKIVRNVMNGFLSINDFYDTKNEFYGLYRQLHPNNLIGKGAVGNVYLVENGKYVIKEANTCYFDVKVLQRYCEDVSNLIDKQPVDIIPSGNKYRYILPNLLSEGIIGMIFNESKISINFGETLATYILLDPNNNPIIYYVMPALTPIIQKQQLNLYFDHPFQYLFLFFQVASGLLAGQGSLRFTHYDLHIGNILLDKWPENYEYIQYPVPNDTPFQFSKKICPYIVKITDFGMSRMETSTVLITPKDSTFPDATFGEFNSTYDIMSFIGSTLFDFRFSPIFFPLLTSNLEFYMILLNLILWIFNDNSIIIKDKNFQKLEQARIEIGNKYYKKTADGKFTYRPASYEKNLVKFFNIRSLSEIVKKLSKTMKQLNMNSNSKENVLFLPSVNIYQKFDKIFPFTTTLNQPSLPESGQISKTSITQNIAIGIKVTTYRALLSAPPNDYNFTITSKQFESCPYQEHYITAITVDPNLFGYNFHVDCCMLDPINYLRDNNFFGFVINGGFFNIKEDYLPIGFDKNKTKKSNIYPIPEAYRDVYGFVGLRNNQMIITQDLDEAEKYEYLFSSGPMLIKNGNIVFDPYEERFACAIPNQIKNSIKIIKSSDEDVTISGYMKYSSKYNYCQKEYVEKRLTIPTCDTIEPGELSHSDNPNPRSVACILKNGQYVFLTVEGRAERGVGIDLRSLSELLLNMYPNIQTAINLDGGRSSNLAWRSSDNPNEIFVANPEHLYQYPVGNILVFKKNI